MHINLNVIYGRT